MERPSLIISTLSFLFQPFSSRVRNCLSWRRLHSYKDFGKVFRGQIKLIGQIVTSHKIWYFLFGWQGFIILPPKTRDSALILEAQVQFSSVAQSCPTLCDPMNCSMPGLPVHHHLPEFTQTHVHRVRDAIQLSHPPSSLSPPAPNPSQHQSLSQWVNSLHEVAKVQEFQL